MSLCLGWIALALESCLLTSPLDDVKDGADASGGRGGTTTAPVAGATSGGGGSGTGGSLLAGAGEAGTGGSTSIPLEEWCPDPVDRWALDNPYWATYELLPEESTSDACEEYPAGEFFMSRDQADVGCEITDSLEQEDACGYGELQICEDAGLQLALVFNQAAPDAPIVGVLLIYPLDASKGDEPACSYGMLLVPQSEL